MRARLKVYHEQPAPLIDYYRRAGLLVEVDGVGGIEAVSGALLEAARNLRDGSDTPRPKRGTP